MHVKQGIVSAVVGASLLGGVGVSAAMASGSTGGLATPTVTLAASSTAAAAPAADCITPDEGSWPPFANGVPAGFDAGSPAGVYLWHDDSGWHLRVSHKNDTHQVYTGV